MVVRWVVWMLIGQNAGTQRTNELGTFFVSLALNSSCLPTEAASAQAGPSCPCFVFFVSLKISVIGEVQN